ncbi:MAG TPA: zinc ribbon domain-containing protein [Pyrinomonadaceae bacterium]|jgi:hypothetical protein|nr:zinc ribbon domain-containing protein [Pyrinomonadaceae bacterium]
MFCPKCSQQQVSETVRFCSRCGFLLEGVSAVVASGGQLPMRYAQSANRELSPRNKGVRQGAMLMLSTLLVVPIVAVLSVTLDIYPEVFIPLVSIFCFIGGLLRMLYALLMEDANPPIESAPLSAYAPPVPQQLEAARPIASAQASFTPAQAWKPRPNTAELFTPPSVTENTTRLLQKEDPEDR